MKKVFKLIVSIFYTLLVLCFTILSIMFVWMTFFNNKSDFSPIMVIFGLIFVPIIIAFIVYLVINVKRVINNIKALKE